MMKALILATAAVVATSGITLAQDAPAEGGRPGRRPAPPLVAALDTNKDGVIDADEIAKSSESLKTLDKDSDGKLTREEVMPERRGGPRGERGEGRKRGPKPEAAQ
jgi:hypothetical protein